MNKAADLGASVLALRRVFDPEHEPEALSQAESLLRRTAERFDADLSTLFVVRDDALVLSAGLAFLHGEEIQLPRHHGYGLEIDWEGSEGTTAKLGMTRRVAMSGEPLWVDSYASLIAHPDHLGKWDQRAYPLGIDHPEDGFGCLYAVPLRTSFAAPPRDSVIGVVKIERRASREPFSASERVAFGVVTAHLSALLRAAAGRGDDGSPLSERVAGTLVPILQLDVNPIASEDDEEEVATSARLDVPSLMAKTEQGFSELVVSDADRRTALRNLRRWLSDAFADYHDQLEWMIDSGKWSLLLDSFYRVLPFGTGGRRGPVGIGTNRFNPFTLMSSVQGHADYLREAHPNEDLSVVIVYDVRHFFDLNEVYNPDLPNPFIDIESRDFCVIAAEVYAAMGIRIFIPAEGSDFVSTPELSFTIRKLGASAGLNISASHNPPDDNGGKFYNAFGAQHVPPSDEDMARRVANVRFLARLNFASAEEAGLIERIPQDIHEQYVEMNVAQSLRPEHRSAHVVFTPLHGTGTTTVGEVLQKAGFEVTLVEAQATPDGAFSEVPFRAPNPEVPESMEMGTSLAKGLGADLVMATDPDADRIGVCARSSDGDYRFLNGNEIAAIVTHYKLEELARSHRLPARPIVVKTEVTTEVLKPITERAGGFLIGDLLVGFKYHGNVLERLEAGTNLPFEGARLSDFVIGAEESHGILVTTEVRDKDAAGAAILLAELASKLRASGRTLLDYLDDIHREFGVYANVLTSMVMTGVEGLRNIQEIQRTMRERPPAKIGRFHVESHADHRDAAGIHGPIISQTDLASRDVLVFRLQNGGRIIIRPSGTEPKNKAYVEVPRAPLGIEASDQALEEEKRVARALAREIADAFTMQMLAIIGVELPAYALRISGLVSLDRKLSFVEQFMPEFEARATKVANGRDDRAAVSAWIDGELAGYGKDARDLVGDAVRAYLASAREKATDSADPLDEMERIFF